MVEGFYWYRQLNWNFWHPCQVKSGYVHFFGQVSQKIGNEYLTEYVEFGPQIHYPEPSIDEKQAEIDYRIIESGRK